MSFPPRPSSSWTSLLRAESCFLCMLFAVFSECPQIRTSSNFNPPALHPLLCSVLTLGIFSWPGRDHGLCDCQPRISRKRVLQGAWGLELAVAEGPWSEETKPHSSLPVGTSPFKPGLPPSLPETTSELPSWSSCLQPHPLRHTSLHP